MTTYIKAKSPLVIAKITQDIIDRSAKADSRSCMIAEAIKIARPDVVNVAVDVQTVRFTDPKKGHRYVYLTPRDGQFPLIQFDQGLIPQPFDLKLRRGQVTSSTVGTTKNDTPEQKAERAKRRLGKAKLTTRSGGTIDVVGGKAPPQMKTKRVFGLKQFGGFGGDWNPENRPLVRREQDERATHPGTPPLPPA